MSVNDKVQYERRNFLVIDCGRVSPLQRAYERDGRPARLPARLQDEVIVNKRRNSPYRSGRSPDWIKSKNPAVPAVRWEADEEWGRSTYIRATNH